MMPAIATMTADSPSSPKPAASQVAGKIHSRPSAEPGAASCMRVMATMSIAGTTATQPKGIRFQGMTMVAPVTTKTTTTPVKKSDRIAVNGPSATSSASTNTTDPSSSWYSVAVRPRVRSRTSLRSHAARFARDRPKRSERGRGGGSVSVTAIP